MAEIGVSVYQAISQVHRLAPKFLTEKPAVHFELLTALFQQLLDSGKTLEALTFIRCKLTPICNQHEFLQQSLKVWLDNFSFQIQLDHLFVKDYHKSVQSDLCSADVMFSNSLQTSLRSILSPYYTKATGN